MVICEWCGTEFDESEAEDEFEIEYPRFSYEHFKKCLCGKCACEVFNEQVDGEYFETCEQCGKEFDFFIDESSFIDHFTAYSSLDLIDVWKFKDKIMCCECGLMYVDEMIEP